MRDRPRTRTLALVAVCAMLASCGGTSRTFTPINEVAETFDRPFSGKLTFLDGQHLRVFEGRILGPWLCARRSWEADICVETVQVSGVEVVKRTPSLMDRVAQGITLVIMSPVIALWIDGERDGARDAKKADEEALERRRLAIERGDIPNISLAESRATGDMIGCFKRATPDWQVTGGAVLAAQVWRDRKVCLSETSEWFAATGDMPKARILYFIHAARRRYEGVACGHADLGLQAPKTELISGASGDWVNDYRRIVVDPATYAYELPHKCNGSEPAILDDAGFPTDSSRAAAILRISSFFPLTERAMPK